MAQKLFPAISLISVLAACLFSSSPGDDKIVGTWVNKEINDTMVFYENGTWFSDYWTAGSCAGTWTKSDDTYWLYVSSHNSIVGSGVVMFNGRNLILERALTEFIYVKA